MKADFLIGDFDNESPFCDSVALLRDFLTSEQLAEKLPKSAEPGSSDDEWWKQSKSTPESKTFGLQSPLLNFEFSRL